VKDNVQNECKYVELIKLATANRGDVVNVYNNLIILLINIG